MACFTKLNGTVITMPSAVACPTSNASPSDPSSSAVTTCCHASDQCLSSGFCLSTTSSPSQSGSSGYYLAGCTDGSYTDPSCPVACASSSFPDAVFDYGAGTWTCCGGSPESGIQCRAPQGATFAAPAPSQLQRLDDQIMASAVQNGNETHQHRHSQHDGGSGHGGASGASSLGEASVIGISVAVSIGTLLLLAVLAFCIFQARRRRKMRPFRDDEQPSLLPAAMRESEPEIGWWAGAVQSAATVQPTNATKAPWSGGFDSASLRTMSTYVSDNGNEPWPLALPFQGMVVRGSMGSVVSDQSADAGAGADADADARSISTWSSFSSGGRSLSIDIPDRDSGLFEMGASTRTVCELGEKSPVVHELLGAVIGVAREDRGVSARESVSESNPLDLPLQRPAEALWPAWMSKGRE
jgi:hypothetical protein